MISVDVDALINSVYVRWPVHRATNRNNDIASIRL